MAIDTETFKQQLTRHKGKLDPWANDIFALLHDGISYQNIAAYLKQNMVKVNPMEVYQYVHRKKRATRLSAIKPGEPATTHNDKAPSGKAPPVSESASAMSAPSSKAVHALQKNIADAAMPRFDFKELKKNSKVN